MIRALPCRHSQHHGLHSRHNLHELPDLTDLYGQLGLYGLHSFKGRTSQAGCSRRAAGRIGKRLAEQMAVKPADWPAYRTVEQIAGEHASWIIEYRPAEQTAGWLKDQAAEQMTNDPAGQIVWQPDGQQQSRASSKALQHELMQRGLRAAGAHCQEQGSLRCSMQKTGIGCSNAGTWHHVLSRRSPAACARPQQPGIKRSAAGERAQLQEMNRILAGVNL